MFKPQLRQPGFFPPYSHQPFATMKRAPIRYAIVGFRRLGAVTPARPLSASDRQSPGSNHPTLVQAFTDRALSNPKMTARSGDAADRRHG